MKTDISLAATMEDLEAVTGVSNAENSCLPMVKRSTLTKKKLLILINYQTLIGHHQLDITLLPTFLMGFI